MSTEKKTIDRRTIAKGAAWTLPVVATAAAAPAASASTTPTCTQCATPTLNVATASASRIRGHAGDLTIPAGAFVANLAGCTGLFNASVLTANSATLTMRHADGSTKSYTTTSGLSVGVSATIATALVGAALTFPGVEFPSGTLVTPGARPVSVSFDVVILLRILGQELQCPQTITFNFSLSVGGYSVNGGAGNGSASWLLAGLL